MGGHQSKQTVLQSTQLLSNIVQKTAQNCFGTTTGDNELNISGSDDNVSDIKQNITLSVKTSCSDLSSQSSTFNTNLQTSIQQTLKDQEVALTQWMDNSNDSQYSSIAQKIQTNVTNDVVQNCINTLDGKNVINITGSGDTVKDATQNIQLSLIAKFLLQNGQTNDVINSITNTTNQHSTYTSKNPLAFITDSIESVSKSIIHMVAIFFIVFICIVFLMEVIDKHSNLNPQYTSMPNGEPATSP